MDRYDDINYRLHGCPSRPCPMCLDLRIADTKLLLKILEGKENIERLMKRRSLESILEMRELLKETGFIENDRVTAKGREFLIWN